MITFYLELICEQLSVLTPLHFFLVVPLLSWECLVGSNHLRRKRDDMPMHDMASTVVDENNALAGTAEFTDTVS